jgi:glycosyltransferase involved in cell wall biosynthesis
MMNIRVCVLSSVHDALHQRVFHKVSRSLAHAGYVVSVIAIHPHATVVDGIRIIPLAQPPNRVSRLFRTGWQIYRKALAEHADIYHFHDPMLLGVGLLLRLHGKQVIYDAHEDLPKDMLQKYYLPRLVRRPMSWIAVIIEALAAYILSGVVVMTPDVAERFARYTKRVYMVRNFAVPGEFPPIPNIPWEERDPAVIYLGALSRIRGIHELVEAIDLVPASLNPKLRLLGPFYTPDLPAELEQLPGWARTEYLGVIAERERVGEQLNQVRAGLVTIYPLPQYLFAYPVKMFEYMAAGIPIIASDFRVYRQFIEKPQCGLLVDPLDPAAIAKAIEYILTHPEEAEAMGKNGRAAMENEFNWSHEEKTLLGLYEDLSARVRREQKSVSEPEAIQDSLRR